jgi:hypothetical protein
MSIGNITGAIGAQQFTDLASCSVVQRSDLHSGQYPGKSGLSGTGSPGLRYDGTT